MNSFFRIFTGIFILGATFATAIAAEKKQETQKTEPERINIIFDLSHQFTFYGDGKFAEQYIPNVKWARNLASIKALNLLESNANLYLLFPPDRRISYTKEDVAEVVKFVKKGGTALIAAESDRGMENLVNVFGVSVEETQKSEVKPVPKFLKSAASSEIKWRGKGRQFKFTDKARLKLKWTPLLAFDGDVKRPVALRAKCGKGYVVYLMRNLFSEQPGRSDAKMNADYICPIVASSVNSDFIDSSKPPKGRDFGNQDYKKEVSGIVIHYSEYLTDCYLAMRDIVLEALPLIEIRMGVPLHGQNGSEIALLATDGGGFSSGKLVALAVYWENFPKERKGMYEFITHELIHSWVAPYSEVWNEPIATYVGDLIMGDVGYREEGDKRIAQTINRARKHDPDFTKCDLDFNNDVHWGKTFWIWEELRKEKPDVLARYFQLKRRYVTPGSLKKYTINETVALLSAAMEKDMYPWFNAHGIKADKEASQLSYETIRDAEKKAQTQAVEK